MSRNFLYNTIHAERSTLKTDMFVVVIERALAPSSDQGGGYAMGRGLDVHGQRPQIAHVGILSKRREWYDFLQSEPSPRRARWPYGRAAARYGAFLPTSWRRNDRSPTPLGANSPIPGGTGRWPSWRLERRLSCGDTVFGQSGPWHGPWLRPRALGETFGKGVV